MVNKVKEAAIFQITKLLDTKGENLKQYAFQDTEGFNIIIKTQQFDITVNLLGFKIDDITEKTANWEKYKERLYKLIKLLNPLFEEVKENNKENEPIELLLKVDAYLPNNLLEHFVKEKGVIKIDNPRMFSGADAYLYSFANLDVLSRFVASKIFFRVQNVYNWFIKIDNLTIMILLN